MEGRDKSDPGIQQIFRQPSSCLYIKLSLGCLVPSFPRYEYQILSILLFAAGEAPKLVKMLRKSKKGKKGSA